MDIDMSLYICIRSASDAAARNNEGLIAMQAAAATRPRKRMLHARTQLAGVCPESSYRECRHVTGVDARASVGGARCPWDGAREKEGPRKSLTASSS